MSFSEKTIRTLEFDKICAMLEEHAETEGAKVMARNLRPSDDTYTVLRRLRRTTDAPEEIADTPDPRLECVRLAPSATNSQPWYFVHQGEGLHVYQVEQGPLKRMTLGKMNCIDMGIALCHLAVTCQGEFALQRQEDAPSVEGYTYIGTVPAL